MHTYQRRWLDLDCSHLDPHADDEQTGQPDADRFLLRSVDDVVEWASDDMEFGSADWLDVLHLDPDGTVTCCCSACSCDSLVTWAQQPDRLVELRLDGLDRGGCGSDWLLIDSRTAATGICIPPCAADEAAFALLSDQLAEIGVNLLDALVFDDRGHWWSLRELTTGSTEWHPGVRAG